MTIGAFPARFENAFGTTSGLIPSDRYFELIVAALFPSKLTSFWRLPEVPLELPTERIDRFTETINEPVVTTGPSAMTDTIEPIIQSDAGDLTFKWLRYVSSRYKEMLERTGDPELPTVSEQAVNRAHEVAYHFFPRNVPPPSVGTTPDGGVEFVWHRGGWDLEIEVSTIRDPMVWAFERESGNSLEGPLMEHLHPIYQLLTDWASEI